MKAKSLINILRKTIKDKLAEIKTNSSLIDLMSDDKVLEFAIGFDSYVKGIEQGKKDAYNSFNLKLGKRTLSMIQADTRKQTLEEVLKDDFDEERQGLRYVFRKKLEQRIKEMG